VTYAFDSRTRAAVEASGTRADRPGTTPGTNSYEVLFGVRRILSSFLTASVSLGPTVFMSDDGENRVILKWRAHLDGTLPWFHPRHASFTFLTTQSIEDTSTAVDNVGYVLRQVVQVQLNYQASRRLHASLFADYFRTELLEEVGSREAVAGREDNYLRAGARVSYALTRILSLVGTYRYQQRVSNVAAGDFAENFVTLTLAAGFPVF
jgi:uncharacterized protein (PEP-CTERM system associated)